MIAANYQMRKTQCKIKVEMVCIKGGACMQWDASCQPVGVDCCKEKY